MKIFIIITSIILLLIMFMFIKNNKKPNKIGVTNGKLAPMPNKPNAVSSQTEIMDKRVEPLKFIGDLENSRKSIIDIINTFKNIKVIRSEDTYIYAVFSTEKMKYKDDVEFYFDEDKKLIHFRSASRVGYSDMGVNRKRYEDIKKLYEAKKIS